MYDTEQLTAQAAEAAKNVCARSVYRDKKGTLYVPIFHDDGAVWLVSTNHLPKTKDDTLTRMRSIAGAKDSSAIAYALIDSRGQGAERMSSMTRLRRYEATIDVDDVEVAKDDARDFDDSDVIRDIRLDDEGPVLIRKGARPRASLALAHTVDEILRDIELPPDTATLTARLGNAVSAVRMSGEEMDDDLDARRALACELLAKLFSCRAAMERDIRLYEERRNNGNLRNK